MMRVREAVHSGSFYQDEPWEEMDCEILVEVVRADGETEAYRVPDDIESVVIHKVYR